ncbi:MAG: YceI family protein [Acidobacteriaceae bacterium]|jgi:polyisoprenoid-binding protein YceI|nr:YceI family protein [Acidobacteriaceae bacterium]
MATETTQKHVIDPSHSEVTFQVRHLLTRVGGRFSKFEGSVDFNEAAPERSTVTVSIDASSIDTSEPNRDQHLRTADFFDVAAYPTLTFVSRTIVRAGEGRFDVHGALTIHGVTKEIVLPMSFLGKARDPWGNSRLGFEGDVTISRKDFGLNWNAALEAGGFLVGDDVKISLSIQAVQQQ